MLRIMIVLLLCGGAFAQGTSAYISGMAGVVAGKYESDSYLYEKLVGYYDYGQPPPAADWPAAELSSTDFAASPFGLGLKAENWQASFATLWNRHKIDAYGGTRQVNAATLNAGGGYILNRGYFAGKKVQPYFGGFFRGTFNKAANTHNGVIGYGFGPDVGAVLTAGPLNSFVLITLGYDYKKYSLSGTKSATARGDDPPTAPFWNYTYIPEDQLPASGSSAYINAKGSIQFIRRLGVEAVLRYEMDLGDTFTNGLTVAVGPSFWL